MDGWTCVSASRLIVLSSVSHTPMLLIFIPIRPLLPLWSLLYSMISSWLYGIFCCIWYILTYAHLYIHIQINAHHRSPLLYTIIAMLEHGRQSDLTAPSSASSSSPSTSSSSSSSSQTSRVQTHARTHDEKTPQSSSSSQYSQYAYSEGPQPLHFSK